jgi:uncharacterized protein
VEIYFIDPMKFELDSGVGRNSIRTYGPGRVIVGEAVYTASLIVTPDRLIPDWPPQRFDDLAAADIEALVALRPEVALLGTGRRLRFPPAAVLAALIEAGIGYEVMDTGAACRTFNVLAGEGRRVAAALLMIED